MSAITLATLVSVRGLNLARHAAFAFVVTTRVNTLKNLSGERQGNDGNYTNNAVLNHTANGGEIRGLTFHVYLSFVNGYVSVLRQRL